jgi:UDP:flavonoid glycosyltransferase YjiC (YdhE family)
MGRFLFVGLDTGGTWKPMLGLAAILVSRGHAVTVLGSPSMETTSRAAGCSFLALPEELDERPGTALEDDGFASWMDKVTGWPVAAALGPAVAACAADVLVIDYLQFNALSAAEQINRPTASVVHFGMTDWGEGEDWAEEIDLLNATRARLGVDALPRSGGMAVLWARPDVALSLLPIQWTPTPMPVNVVTVGPIAAARRGAAAPRLPWPDDDPRPLVVISMSSTYMHQEALLSRIAGAVAELPVRALLSLAGAVSPIDVQVPPSVAVRTWLDFDDILPLTDLLITHGGMATTTSALMHGVPELVIPQSRDQHRNAARVADAGAGLVVGADSSAQEIRAAIGRLLSDDSYRRAADRFGETLRELGAGRIAVERLEGLLPTRPAMPLASTGAG